MSPRIYIPAYLSCFLYSWRHIEGVRSNHMCLNSCLLIVLGSSPWPPGCSLKFNMGHQLGASERVMVDVLQPGAECDVSVPMTSPTLPGMYHGQWRMSSPTGSLFGGKYKSTDYYSI